jgi:hypothetical protein
VKPANFQVQLGSTGSESVVVNDQDVTDVVDAVSIFAQEGAPPVVRLGLKPGVEVGAISGVGVVEVQPAGGGGADDVGRWLGAIDFAELERVVLERSQFSTMSSGGSPIAVALEVLKEWAAGRT